MPFIVWLCQVFQMSLNTDLVNALLTQSLSSPTLEAAKFSSFKMKWKWSECCSHQHLRGRRKVTHEWNQVLTTLQISKSNCKACAADLTCGNKNDRKRLECWRQLCAYQSHKILFVIQGKKKKRSCCWKWSKIVSKNLFLTHLEWWSVVL